MKFCPQCGAQNDDTNSFCYMCGTPLNGDARHEEPKTEQTYVPPYAAQVQKVPKSKKSSALLYAAIALIVAAIILTAAIIPTLLVSESNYEVTITVDSVSIKDQAGQYALDGSGRVTYEIEMGYGSGSAKDTLQFKNSTSDSYKCRTDGTPVTPGVSKTVTINGNPKDFIFTVFLLVDTGSIRDYVDIYTEEGIVDPAPSYIGYSGIVFGISDIKDGKVTLKGDSDPIGNLVLSITYVKK